MVSSGRVCVVVVMVVMLVGGSALACGRSPKVFSDGSHHGFSRCVYGACEAASEDLDRAVRQDLDLDLVLD
jgi:hypothetical protein